MRKLLILGLLATLSFGCTKVVTKKEYVYLTTSVNYVDVLELPSSIVIQPSIINGMYCFSPDQMSELRKYTIRMNRHAVEQKDLNESYNEYLKRHNERK